MPKPFVFVLAGGSGTRLAPLSLTIRDKLPKQFLALVGQKTMLQQTLERIPEGQLVVIPEERYVPAIQEQCAENVEILAEPFGCNTAAAVGLGALYALHKTNDRNTILFFLPADHIMDKTVFQKLFHQAIKLAQTGKIITLGITPDRPETGYGYIKTQGRGAYLQVDAFVEKPDLQTAQKYLDAGNYFWNAGMFVMTIDTVLSALERNAPLIYQELQGIDFNKNLSVEIARQYQKIKAQKQNISIDYAVMEKEAENILLLPAPSTLNWNDVGGWIALAKYYPVDKDNNLLINYTADKIQVSDLHNLLVVDSENGILICPQTLAQRAKDIIPGIEKNLVAETIDCKNVNVQNQTERYIGVIGLENATIYYNAGLLTVKKP